jgi:parvulin-like peptidyl-prolyl isomerase
MRIVYLLLIFLLFNPAGFGQQKIVAVVNNEVITDKELRDSLRLNRFDQTDENLSEGQLQQLYDQEKEMILERLIEERLMIQAAKESDIEVPEEKIQKRVDDFAANFRDSRHFEDSLVERGLSIKALKARAVEQYLMRMIIAQKIRGEIEVAPYEITDYYRAHPQEFIRPPSIDYRALKFPQTLTAYQAFEDLRRSDDVEEVVGKYQSNLITGSLNQNECRKELEELFSLEKGEYSQLISLGSDDYIFIIDRINPAQRVDIAEVKQSIWQAIYQDKFAAAMNIWLAELKEKAIIKRIGKL